MCIHSIVVSASTRLLLFRPALLLVGLSGHPFARPGYVIPHH